MLACLGHPPPIVCGSVLRAFVVSARCRVSNAVLSFLPKVLSELVVQCIDYLDPACLNPDTPDAIEAHMASPR
jgi:hypothetical protein